MIAVMTQQDIFEKVRSHESSDLIHALRQHDLLPYFRSVDGAPGPIARIDGQDRIILGSNNYLGLTGHEAVKAGARSALEEYGTGLAGSRLLNGTTALHIALENELADWMGTEDAIVFSTGYQANLGCIAALLGPDDTVICDSGDHASIFDAVSMSRARSRPFRHNRLDMLEKLLVGPTTVRGGRGGGTLVVVDGVFSMEGDLAHLSDIVRLCHEHGARLMVDEAHGVGVLGAAGTGLCEAYGVSADVDLRMGTFSKSLASCGGFVAGPAEVIEFLRFQSHAFMFSAAAVPAAVGAALAALRVIRSEEGQELRGRVLENAHYLQRGLVEIGIDTRIPTPMPDGSEVLAPILPVPMGSDQHAISCWRALYDAGIYVNVAVHPAVPPGQALLRTSVMATHEREHLDRALAAFAKIQRDLPEQDPTAAAFG